MSLRSHLRHSSEGRDAALDRLRWVNRSIIAGSVALTAIFADTAANTFAGGTTHAKRARAVSSAAKHRDPGHSKAPATPLAPPKEAPKQAAPRTETESEAAPAQETTPPASESTPAQESQHTEAPVEQHTEAPVEQHTEAPVEQHTESAPEVSREEAPVVSGGS